jgi:hypothetical protein
VGSSWSSIVLAAVIPLVAFLVYFHARWSGPTDRALIYHR